jgi:hypothetical protein
MNPVYEHGHGNGIGHELESFLERFDVICLEHLRNKRAKAFAFIFYDFKDRELRKILKNLGVFAQLDRLAGDELSVFYLHTGARATIESFNTSFLSKLEVEDKATPPCVVFFRVSKGKIEDITVVQLDAADLVHGFHELYGVIESYLRKEKYSYSLGLHSLTFLKRGAGFISLEVFRAVLKKALEVVF